MTTTTGTTTPGTSVQSRLPGLNAVIDLSHHNRVASFADVRKASILGVLHKSSQGFSFGDPLYVDHRKGAQDAGLRWGAYHFGVAGDGVAQAEHFLETAAPLPGDLLVLDLEANWTGGSMSLEDAEDFVSHVYTVMGRWPGIYGGSYLRDLVSSAPGTALANCWLWFARYASTIRPPPPWKTWTLWQYTDGAAGPGPHDVPGVGPCDRDIFNGTEAQLVTFWGA